MILTDDEKRALAEEVKTILVSESLSIDELEKVESLNGVSSLPSHLTQEGLTKVVAVPISLLRKPAEEAATAAEEVITRAEEAIVETQTATATANAAVEQVEITKADTILATQEARDAAASVDASKQQAEEAAAAANKATESAYKSADDADTATVELVQTGIKLQQDVETAITETNTAVDAANEVAETLRRLVNSVVEQLVTEADRLNWNNKYTKEEADVKHTQLQELLQKCVNDAIAELIGGAPDALNALNELAAAINNDPNFSASIMAMINGKADLIHNHTKAQISDFPASMPASDVSLWAKQPNKPGYTPAEIGAAASGHTHPATAIIEDSSHRFITDTLLSKLTGLETTLDGKLTVTPKYAGDVDTLTGSFIGKLYDAKNAPYNFYPFFSFGYDQYRAQFNAINNSLKFRSSNGNDGALGSWVDIWHSGNLLPNTKVDTSIYLGGTDLDTISRPGFYNQHYADDATTARHYPVKEAGSLIVTPSAYQESGTTNQIYTTFATNRMFIRSGGTSPTTRTAWREVWHSGNFNPADMLRPLSDIQEAQLNSAIQPGFRRVNYTDHSRTLLTLTTSGSAMYCQLLFNYSSYSLLFRTSTEGVFSKPWKELATTGQLPTVFVQAMAPTSGMKDGDIWVKP